MLYLEDNGFTGKVPAFNQTSLRFFNVSNNQLSGQIPVTPPLVRFNTSSFSGNVALCGEQIQSPCVTGPSISPAYPRSVSAESSKKRKKLIMIVTVSCIGGFVLISICLMSIVLISKKSKKTEKNRKTGDVEKKREAEEEPTTTEARGSGTDGNNGGKQGGFSWEGEGLGNLVFCGAGEHEVMSYSLEDLLKASAETLGRGSIGSTYKAVLESGFIVTVKRLKDARYPRLDEFRRHVEIIGRLRHPNLVPLRAYFQAKEERLLVYDYFPNGSLFSLIHGKLQFPPFYI